MYSNSWDLEEKTVSTAAAICHQCGATFVGDKRTDLLNVHFSMNLEIASVPEMVFLKAGAYADTGS